MFAELRGLGLKTMGLADVLHTALARLSRQIDAAFIYGSVACQQDAAQSDVDVMIISSTLGHGRVFGKLETATVSLGRKINPRSTRPPTWPSAYKMTMHS